MHHIPAVESQRIDDIADTVKRAKTAVEDCMNRLEHERLARIDNTSRNALSEARMTRQTLHGHHDIMMRAIGNIAARQNESQLQGDNNMRDMFKECFQEVLSSAMQTGLYRLVEETEYCQSKSPPYPRYSRACLTLVSGIGCGRRLEAPESMKTEILTITKDELLLQLNLREVGSIVEDVDRIRQQGTNVASEGRELARKIMTTTQFTEWIQKDESRLLQVDGHCKDLGNGKTSPLSVLCASLASNLADSDSLVVLQYYCGHHGLDSNGLPAGPLGLIKSLLSQLLRKSDSVLSQNLQLDKELDDRADPDDVDNLCEIFGAVFSQIYPNKITLCIIDEIAEFEGSLGGWSDGMSLIAHQLRWMVHKFQGPQKLKVLMTSANKSAVVSQILEENDKISFRGSGLPNHSPGRLVMSSSSFSFS